MNTVRDLIKRSMKYLGVTMGAAELSGEDAEDALIELNGMIHEWAGDVTIKLDWVPADLTLNSQLPWITAAAAKTAQEQSQRRALGTGVAAMLAVRLRPEHGEAPNPDLDQMSRMGWSRLLSVYLAVQSSSPNHTLSRRPDGFGAIQ
ncbi:MAG: hypothetical protein AAFQ22_07170 [Pseudomonadota bacterium]